jgi:ankyrin repeat protein
VIKALIERGADVDKATTDDGQTPLLNACLSGHVEIVKTLLEGGAAIDQSTTDGTTPLYVACQEGHIDTARWLRR